jgi:hypothetical protein
LATCINVSYSLHRSSSLHCAVSATAFTGQAACTVPFQLRPSQVKQLALCRFQRPNAAEMRAFLINILSVFMRFWLQAFYKLLLRCRRGIHSNVTLPYQSQQSWDSPHYPQPLTSAPDSKSNSHTLTCPFPAADSRAWLPFADTSVYVHV